MYDSLEPFSNSIEYPAIKGLRMDEEVAQTKRLNLWFKDFYQSGSFKALEKG